MATFIFNVHHLNHIPFILNLLPFFKSNPFIFPLHQTTKVPHFKLTSTITRSELAKLPVLSFDGSKIGETIINLKSVGPDTACAVVHHGITTDLNNTLRGTTSILTHAEFCCGVKKDFQPKPRDWSVKIKKKEKRLAIMPALASATMKGIVVEEFGENFEK